MSKPFQFSMRRMFAAATLFCIAAMLWTRYLAMHDSDLDTLHAHLLSFLYYLGSFIAAGAGIGTLTRTPWYGAGWGALFAIIGAGVLTIFR